MSVLTKVMQKKWVWWLFLLTLGGFLFLSGSDIYFIFPLLWAFFYTSYFCKTNASTQTIGYAGVGFGLMHMFAGIHLHVYEQIYGVSDGHGMAWAIVLLPALVAIIIGFAFLKIKKDRTDLEL